MDISQLKALSNQHDHDGDHVLKPKLRKPYTITKQREKWTDDEHSKFLDALKLHGRAWRQIEEFIGTKTAVQIRSHAQKFFSKVVRSGNDTTESLVEAIEIPPPRPKRKPAHPYPRKLVDSQRNVELAAFQQEKRKCSNILTTNYASHSPNSVLPAAMPLPVPESPDSCLSSSSGSADMQYGSLFSVNNVKTDIPTANSLANLEVDISADICIKYSEEVSPPEVTIILFGQVVSTKARHLLHNDTSPTHSLAGSQTDASYSVEEQTHEKQLVSSLMKNDSPKGLPSALNFTHLTLLGGVGTTGSKRAYKSGFVPYQRCFAAGNIKSANALAEEEGSQLVQLCL